MIAVLAVCLAIAVVAVVWLVAQTSRLRRDLAAANDRATALEADLAAAKEASGALETTVTGVRAELEAASSRAGEAERTAADLEASLAEARAATEAAEAAAVEVREQLAAAETERDDARSALGQAGWGGGPGPDTLWTLELARTQRTWRTSVAADPTSDAFEERPDALRAAIEIDLAAIREEAGVEVAVDWELVDRLEPLAALAVLRSAQELVAAATRMADDARLVVEPADADVVVRVAEPDGSTGRFTDLGGALEGRGLQPVEGGVRVLGALDATPD